MPEPGELSGARTLSALIRAHRRQLRLSQEDLALLAGISVRTVSDIERGRVLRPRRETLHMLTEALGMEEPHAAAVRSVSTAAPHLPAVPHPVGVADLPPHQLPRGVDRLSGRAAEVAAGTRYLAERADPAGSSGGAVMILSGGPGVGKTACAVHLAHRVAALFPDGQLHLALDDRLGGPMDPMALTAQVADWLGITGDRLPDRLDARSAELRSVLANRRVLLVVDGVSTEEQLLPLLPGQGASAVLATSRRRLQGLDDVRCQELGPFDPEAATEMLVDQLGTRRVAAERAEARELVALCAGLPLALRISCLHLTARPYWSIAKVADMLRDERRRLDVLETGSLSARASFGRSHQLLDAEAARMYRVLAGTEAGACTAETAARGADLPVAVAERGLERLVETYLAWVEDPATAPVRYRLDGLSQLYAREQRPDARRRGHPAAARPGPAGRVRADHCLPRRAADPAGR